MRDFRGKNIQCSLLDIIPHVVEFCRDQYGARLIQYRLDTASNEEKHLLCQAIQKECGALIFDPFANYVIQKLLELGNLNQRRLIAEALSGKVVELSFHDSGCWVMQRVIEALKGPGNTEQIKLIEELKGNEIKLIEDRNGNHVIQKCIEKMPNYQIQYRLSNLV